MTASRCIPVEEIHHALELAEGDPRHAHLRECPRCRALADQFRAFVEASPTGVDERLVLQAEVELRAALQREIGEPVRRAGGSRPAPGARWWESLLAPAWKPALAVAGLAVVAAATVWWSGSLERGEPALRGEPVSRVEILSVGRVSGVVELSWKPWSGADGYEVRLFSERLDEIGRIGTTETSFRLTADRIPEAGRTGSLLVRIVALSGGDEIASSDVMAVERP